MAGAGAGRTGRREGTASLGQGSGTGTARQTPVALSVMGMHRESRKSSESLRSTHAGNIPGATGGESPAGLPAGPPPGPSALPPRLEPAPGRLQLRRHSHEIPVAGGTVLFPVAVLEDGYG